MLGLVIATGLCVFIYFSIKLNVEHVSSSTSIVGINFVFQFFFHFGYMCNV